LTGSCLQLKASLPYIDAPQVETYFSNLTDYWIGLRRVLPTKPYVFTNGGGRPLVRSLRMTESCSLQRRQAMCPGLPCNPQQVLGHCGRSQRPPLVMMQPALPARRPMQPTEHQGHLGQVAGAQQLHTQPFAPAPLLQATQ
jgi:hypothetical protein